MNEILKQKLLEIDHLGSIISQLSWDESTYMPPKAGAIRSDIHAYLSGLLQQKSTDKHLSELIQELSTQENISFIEKKIIHYIQKKEHYYSVLPQKFYQELSQSFSKGVQAWEEARKQSDFSLYASSLEQNIKLTKQLAKALGEFDTPYDALLDIYEEGLTSKYLDTIFTPLKKETINLIDQTSNKAILSIPEGIYPKKNQEEIAKDLLELMGFDLKAGNLAESVHPFTSASQPKDVRLTVNYNEKDFLDSFYALLHEGGHGLYEQNIQESLYGTGLCTGTTMSIHESCSRIMENQVGRSQEFLDYYFPQLAARFPQLNTISSSELYHIVNQCQASLIRIQADEVSYNLHIIIRYEMEKLMINEDIDVNELPSIWNNKYQQYLGITPKNDLEGILQDVHWSCMLMGYFPSYTLGSVYATQLFNKFQETHPIDYKNGTLSELVNWMKQHVYQYGSLYNPHELISKITGKTLDIDAYIQYLNHKYK